MIQLKNNFHKALIVGMAGGIALLIGHYLIGVAAMFGENGRWGAAGGGASITNPSTGGI